MIFTNVMTKYLKVLLLIIIVFLFSVGLFRIVYRAPMMMDQKDYDKFLNSLDGIKYLDKSELIQKMSVKEDVYKISAYSITFDLPSQIKGNSWSLFYDDKQSVYKAENQTSVVLIDDIMSTKTYSIEDIYGNRKDQLLEIPLLSFKDSVNCIKSSGVSIVDMMLMKYNTFRNNYYMYYYKAALCSGARNVYYFESDNCKVITIVYSPDTQVGKQAFIFVYDNTGLPKYILSMYMAESDRTHQDTMHIVYNILNSVQLKY